MRDHAGEALDLVRGKVREELDANRMLSLAVVRLLEILGEAASRAPPSERVKYPRLPWSQLVAMRNRVIHAYDRVDLDVLWEILVQDLPGLVTELDAIVPSAGE